MMEIENDCVGCPQGCINCGRKHSRYFYCDDCGDCVEPDKLYIYDGEELCESCLVERFKTVQKQMEEKGEW